MPVIGNYNQTAMFDSYMIRTTSVTISEHDVDIVMESCIQIRDDMDYGIRITHIANELAHRMNCLQMVASSSNITTAVIEEIVKLYVGALPERPNFGYTTKG